MKKLGVEDVSEYSTHSMRKTKPSIIYDKTQNVDAVRRLLGQRSIVASAYLGVSDNSALELARISMFDYWKEVVSNSLHLDCKYPREVS